MPSLRIVLAQLNVTVGDVRGNRRRIEQAIRQARAWLADIVVVPELAVTGYPPEDLLLKPQFVQDNLDALRSLAAASRGLVAVVGYVDRDAAGRLYNAAAVLADGRQAATYRKQCLPNYGVFDEKRYFIPGARPLVLSVSGVHVGLLICEDLWLPQPPKALARAGAQLAITLSASPYHAGKLKERERLFAQQARSNGLAMAYCNLVGGQDELVFDGASLVLDARGALLVQGAQFREDVVVVDLPASRLGRHRPVRAATVTVAGAPTKRPPLPPGGSRPLRPVEEVYEALTLGVRDYVRKNGFSTVVLGLSGGIDSALTATVAVDALGTSQVVGVVMPSRFSSHATQSDARRLAAALGIRCHTVSIEPVFQAYLKTLARLLGRSESPVSVTEQNIQARIRGNLLMALSNRFGWLVLTTGNKSEIATGYTTLYGDMAGGFAVLKDVPKTLVYELARHRNGRPRGFALPREIAERFPGFSSGNASHFTGRSKAYGGRQGPGAPIPSSVFRRAPSAELAPHQRDQDTLPPYGVLDRILRAYVEEDRSFGEILRSNRFEPATVRRVLRMIDRAEYKRRQGAPGIKITPRAFGKDRRMPITNSYRQD